jgi:hypothetical protein
VRISGSNAGYIMFRGSVKGTGYPRHSPVSPSLSLPSVSVCHRISTGLYKGFQLKPNTSMLEPERLLHVCPAACVIAQQYSSATFHLIALSFLQERIQCAFQKCCLLISLDVFKSRNTEIAKSGTVYSVFLIAALLSRAESGD